MLMGLVLLLLSSKKCTYLNRILILYIPFLDIDDCVNHKCSNGGSCIDGVNSFSCNCLTGFTGNYCEIGRLLLSLLLLWINGTSITHGDNRLKV